METKITDNSISDIQKEIKFCIENLQKLKNDSSDIEFQLTSPVFVKHFDSMVSEISNIFDLNKIRIQSYDYAFHVDNDDSIINIPASTVTRYINGFQKTIKYLDEAKKPTLNIANILRGSTVICFNYSNPDDFFLEDKFLNPVGVDVNKKLSDIYKALSMESGSAVKEIKKIVKNENQRKNVLNGIRSISPTPGSGKSEIKIFGSFPEENSVSLDIHFRQVINEIYPTGKKKDIRVNWDNKTVIGYARELNNVSKSFMLFEDDESSDEPEMIKIHYDANSFEDNIRKNFRKKVLVEFEKIAQNKYKAVRIKEQK